MAAQEFILYSHIVIILAMDVLVNWHGQNSNLIFTGGSDGIIRLWDVRNYNQPIKR